MEKPFP